MASAGADHRAAATEASARCVRYLAFIVAISGISALILFVAAPRIRSVDDPDALSKELHQEPAPNGVYELLPSSAALPTSTIASSPSALASISASAAVSSVQSAPPSPVASPTSSTAGSKAVPSSCGSFQSRRACVLSRHPVMIAPACEDWEPAVLDDSCDGYGGDAHFSPQQAQALLNHTDIFFVGDSTVRRSGEHLFQWLTGSAFKDIGGHGFFKLNLKDANTNFAAHWTFYWVPTYDEFLSNLNGDKPGCSANNCEFFPEPGRHATKLIVLALSIWDMTAWLQSPTQPGHYLNDVPAMVQKMSDALTLFKNASFYDPQRDVLLFRLPLAEDCNFNTNSGTRPSFCNSTSGADPVNDLVKFAIDSMLSKLQAEHADVPLLDVWSWTKGAIGRAPCTEADHTGVHFAFDNARLAFVQQILNAAQLIACDKSAWLTK